ncbi:hypothetical protein CPB83DRAFT_848264 [Crepidotus variabilis]|uniref:COX assembly mitochondrial protein n=1 Tax=Crepidotus variabilis TaxID=179855 RepID=A0A9P6EMW1_9AGAR|nr:hypothetical protein CPB83DRAFT_848264 [Crepidotus variabilis]
MTSDSRRLGHCLPHRPSATRVNTRTVSGNLQLELRPLRLKNMNALSRREEDTLLKATKKYAMKECDSVLKEFAACASGRTVSVAWACRDHLKVVQQCMVQFTAPEPMEQVRQEYIRLRNIQERSNIS